MDEKLVPMSQCIRNFRYIKMREKSFSGGIMLILSGVSFILDYKIEEDILPAISAFISWAGLLFFLNVISNIKKWNYIALKELQFRLFTIGLTLFDIFGVTAVLFRYANPGMTLGVIVILGGLNLLILSINMKLFKDNLFVEPKEELDGEK